jgi:hydroxymethylbilane synthase
VAQLLRRRPDLEVRGIRGNVDTRLRKVHDGEFAAIVLAEAGLTRLGRTAEITERFDLGSWPTSAGQGALAVEVRTDDPALSELVATVGDATSATVSLLERAVLRRLEAGCAAPVGISARAEGEQIELAAEVYALDGARSVRVERRVPASAVADEAGRAAVAHDVVGELHPAGAGDLADLPGTGR